MTMNSITILSSMVSTEMKLNRSKPTLSFYVSKNKIVTYTLLCKFSRFNPYILFDLMSRLQERIVEYVLEV